MTYRDDPFYKYEEDPYFDIEDDPAKVAQANRSTDSYRAPDGWCEFHGAVWPGNDRRCETAAGFKNAKHTCSQPSNIG